jgi:hypothetical protein
VVAHLSTGNLIGILAIVWPVISLGAGMTL